MFEKNLTDLVRGIRNNKDNEAKYVASCLDDIKTELRQENASIKANAVAKLAYLEMLGYDISWAAFNIIEVMSSSKFTYKRIGYLAASQSFHEGLDILMLTTNMIRKDLCSMNMYDSGVALAGFSCFVTPDLARDLANDVMSLLVSTKPYIRKRSILLMYKIFLKFPEALRPAFPRLREKLEDPEPGVQSAAVNVICELARKNPKNYLSLAPLFFKLMTSSTNNWMLIKIIKLFGALCPLEPRLGKKLLEPLTNLIHSTSAMSLLYECINTVICGLSDHQPSIQLCVSKLRLLLEDPDQNLKYLALLAMSKILKTHPKAVQSHKDIIIHCLDDKDESIRLRALDLVVGMVSKKNIMDIIKKLMIHIDKADSQNYRDELLSKIIMICSQGDYQYVTNFEWYVDVLIQLTRIEGTRYGKQVAAQMMDVTIRVKAVRPYAVQCFSLLLDNSHLMGSNVQKNGMCEVLYAVAWLAGEFAQHLPDVNAIMESLLRPKVTSLPGHIQAVFVQCIAKLYASILVKMEQEEDVDAAIALGERLAAQLPMFVQSSDLEVQERASCILQLIKYVLKLQGKGVHCGDEVNLLFDGELNPVASKAQKKVPVPEGLDLDKWINEPPKETSEEEDNAEDMFAGVEEQSYKTQVRKEQEPDEEELEKRRVARQAERESNPHYLRLGETTPSSKKSEISVDDIPVANLDLPVSLKISGLSVDKKYKKTKKKKRRKGRHGSRADDSDDNDDGFEHHKYEVLPTGAGEMPEGGKGEESSGEEEDVIRKGPEDPHKLLDVDLDKPLDTSEALPVRTHRVVSPSREDHQDEAQPREEEEKKVKKSKRRKDKEKKGKHKQKKDDNDEKRERREKREARTDKARKTAEPDLMLNGQGPAPPAEHVSPADGEPEDSIATASVEPTADTTAKDGKELDDMEFWLSTSTEAAPTATEPEPPQAIPEPEPTAKKSSKHKKTESGDQKKKTRKSDKTEKKHKKRHRQTQEEEPEVEHAEPKPDAAADLSIMDDERTAPMPAISTYKVLAENNSLKLTYETRVSPQNRNQVVVSIIFCNQTDLHVKSIEFNVLDSLNTKLIRPIGYSSRDSVPVPFQLPPGSSNEGQFAFTVESIVMAQRLRGTLTYMIKDADGSTSEKMDFSIILPCSAFLVASPLSSSDFASLLGSGSLTNKASTKFKTSEEVELATAIAKICTLQHFAVVEHVDHGASLYSTSVQGHHVCLLVKDLGNHEVSIDGKCTDVSLVSCVLDEARSLFTS
ncbi:AP-3 complex subunit delta-1 isoform X2 [Nematostella vectensis]|uniref:AP-3 complex subunit delta-1 isoform X2 n=1 Tax=Nematostella vectensis TaxID=45351 RepID=UPI0013901636|nr:AP-3 complex subunit delta-1 isoform X2 [Nematostella vectensis]